MGEWGLQYGEIESKVEKIGEIQYVRQMRVQSVLYKM